VARTTAFKKVKARVDGTGMRPRQTLQQSRGVLPHGGL
jgi:hypothetical protein